MNTKEAIRASLDLSLFVLDAYLADLSDADMLRRPGPGCNHLAWQLGHLISSEEKMLDEVCPGQGGKLPPGFAESHSKDACGVDDPAKFLSKDEYLKLFEQVRSNTLTALDGMPDAALDGPSPEWIRAMFPTVGQFFVLIGTHPMMHAGQFAVVRRALGKPIVI